MTSAVLCIAPLNSASCQILSSTYFRPNLRQLLAGIYVVRARKDHRVYVVRARRVYMIFLSYCGLDLETHWMVSRATLWDYK